LGQADPPQGYYQAVGTQQGTVLRQVLHEIIDDHAALTYLATREALKQTDENPANPSQVVLVYSRRPEDKANFVTNGGNATQWNREHIWPNSLGIDDVEPAYSDLFNLRPADVDVNARRGNLSFDEFSTAEAPVTADPEAPLCTRDANSWEVPAEQKGDIARSMFYMDVRYEGGMAGEPDLILTDDLTEITELVVRFRQAQCEYKPAVLGNSPRPPAGGGNPENTMAAALHRRAVLSSEPSATDCSLTRRSNKEQWRPSDAPPLLAVPMVVLKY
jgi:endonuclease I